MSGPLFKLGDFVMHAGGVGHWKIECDALTDDDWTCLALMASERLPSFNAVVGVPRGGLKFAQALRRYRSDEGACLIVDDVLTSGTSMREAKAGSGRGEDVIGVVAFNRSGLSLPWVTSLFTIAAVVTEPEAT